MIISWLRKNIGIIISVIGLALLIILTFGDMGELFTEEYWKNVGGNLSSITALTMGLVMVQVAIKQGVSEQALSAGLNTENTKTKYIEHKGILERNREKSIYLPYFLTMRNKRETDRRKKEFLIDNNFTNEQMLRLSKNKRLIRKYDAIKTNVTADSIKWSTTDIVYNKHGRIEKLNEFRRKRTIRAIAIAILTMLGSTLIAGGLFLDVADIPFWQKLVKFMSYLITMAIMVVFDITKNYEKGAFSVPNELDEVNNIWKEFELWIIPEEIKKEVEKDYLILSSLTGKSVDDAEEKGDVDVKREDTIDTGTDIQEESEEVEAV